MRRVPGLLALVLLGLAGPAWAQGSSFFTVTPCRAVDTRNAVDPTGPWGGPALGPNSVRAFDLAGRCGVSTGATAISVNVTIVGPTTAGFLSFYPAGMPRPVVSTINYSPGQVRANNAVLSLGADGGVTCAAALASGSVHLLIDVNGYFADPGLDRTVVAPAVLNPPPGTYTGSQNVSLFSSTPGAQIRYTLDGTDPTRTTGALYSGPVAVTASATLKAIAFLDGLADSAVVAGAYAIGQPPTLFIARMSPQGAALSTGSGFASLLLSADATSAVLRFSFSNLTSPVTGEHVHGPADPGASGPILFDIDAATPQADGSYLWTFVPVGTTSVDQIVAAIRAGRTYINIHTASYPAGEIRGQFVLSTGTGVFTPPPPPPDLPGGPPTARDAARFLTQATYGPTPDDVAALQAEGFDAWLAQQFQAPLASHLTYLDAAAAAGEDLSSNQVMESIWQQAVQGPDPLRQRVALALSEIFVVSDDSSALDNQPEALASYMDVLERDAFGNFRQFLEDVTLSPAMGVYLNMLGNDKEDPAAGQNPNENYAREILQLFSIGLVKLFPDGTLQLDARGLPIPTYNQETVMGLARVFTGWSFGGNDTTNPDLFYNPVEMWRIPMEPWPSHHSDGPKQLLDGASTAAGLTPGQDLQQALDDIFNHPNVGPFIARLLIQRLVTSNPSPAYVYRVAQAFADNGHGVRGDLQAVVRAILRDYEARAEAVTANQGYGHLREPIVRLGGLLRAFNATAPSGKYRLWNLEDPTFALGQNPLRATTVFNFFKPDFSLAGPVASAGLVSPEFQILSETSAIGGANFMRGLIYDGYGNGADLITLDFSRQLALAADPAQLVDSLDLLLMSNGMSPAMRAILVATLSDPSLADPGDRVRAAVRLIVTSPEYLVER
ncbi:MAG TPA: DUF1800 family protein [Thermoanaerobaculia bacterium]|nr:DUF1800 family protein [Thermoanaerobaculia bacterium]